MDKSQVNIIILQIDRNKSHVNIKISCRGQKYATTFANSIFQTVVVLPNWPVIRQKQALVYRISRVKSSSFFIKLLGM